MKEHRVFLDANVLVSAALGPGLCRALFDFARAKELTLLTSTFALQEAARNVPPAKLAYLDQKLLPLLEVFEPDVSEWVCPIALEEKDRPILAAAVLSKATHLVTGDRSHFGAWYGAAVEGVRICSVRRYLHERGDLE
jgi:putative PIN family toxin of toxin-antitoxin system